VPEKLILSDSLTKTAEMAGIEYRSSLHVMEVTGILHSN
jgi:hypothetical protein